MSPAPKRAPSVRMLAPALATVTAALLVPPASAGADLPAAEQERQGAAGYARAAVKATNAQRSERDLVRLDRAGCLQRKAARQARKMARRGEIFHQDLGPVLRDCGLASAGENVASGFPTGRATVQGWMGSEGHRANILRADYRLIGLAARRSGGVWYVAQVFGAR